MNSLLDNIAKATIEVFQQSADGGGASNPASGLFHPGGIAGAEVGGPRQNGIKTLLRYVSRGFIRPRLTCHTEQCACFAQSGTFSLTCRNVKEVMTCANCHDIAMWSRVMLQGGGCLRVLNFTRSGPESWEPRVWSSLQREPLFCRLYQWAGLQR